MQLALTLEEAVVRMKAEHASMAASMAAAQERAVALAKEVAELQAERDALRSESGSGRRAVGEVEGLVERVPAILPPAPAASEEESRPQADCEPAH